MLALGACSSGLDAAEAPAASSGAVRETATAPAVKDLMSAGEEMVPVEPATYFVDADLDPSTPLRAVFEIPAEGWLSWIGAAKFAPVDGHVDARTTRVVNPVTDGCKDHLAADAPEPRIERPSRPTRRGVPVR